jgi:hypothetical protein
VCGGLWLGLVGTVKGYYAVWEVGHPLAEVLEKRPAQAMQDGQPSGAPVVTGVPIRLPDESIDTDSMTGSGRAPVVQGTRVAFVRQASAALTERTQNRSGQLFQMVLNFVLGILLPVYALVIYYNTNAPDAPCDKPVAGWLYTYAMVGLTAGIVCYAPLPSPRDRRAHHQFPPQSSVPFPLYTDGAVYQHPHA